MQHRLNNSSTSEWVASDGDVEGKTKREGGKADEWERKRGDGGGSESRRTTGAEEEIKAGRMRRAERVG